MRAPTVIDSEREVNNSTSIFCWEPFHIVEKNLAVVLEHFPVAFFEHCHHSFHHHVLVVMRCCCCLLIVDNIWCIEGWWWGSCIVKLVSFWSVFVSPVGVAISWSLLVIIRTTVLWAPSLWVEVLVVRRGVTLVVGAWIVKLLIVAAWVRYGI